MQATLGRSRSPRLAYLRDLLRELVVRDMKVRYKRSLLGFIWSLMNPLAYMLVLTFVFRRVLPLEIQNYPVFVFSGLLAWNWFATSLTNAAGAITDNGALIRRPGFPRAILPLVTVTTGLAHFLLALPILLVFLLIGHEPLNSAALWLPGVMAIEFILTLGLAYLVATAHVIYRDTQHLIGVALLLLFFLTPIFYHGSAIPAEYLLIYQLNPMAQLVDAFRAILVRGEPPDFLSLLGVGLFGGGLLWLGHTVFVRTSYRFAEEL